jgi:acetoin utilization deacetylase AcuC-like enzyme
VLISAGYDAHRDDPAADCTVTEEGFAAMAGAVSRACASLDAHVGAVLEGGYTLDALGRSVAATLQALSEKPAGGATAAPPADLTPIARQARTRLADLWPQLRTKDRPAATP